MEAPVWLGGNRLTPLLWTRSLDDLLEILDDIVIQTALSRLARCLAVARIEDEALYEQVTDPDTGSPYASAAAYFSNPEVADRYGIPADRRRRSELLKQGRAILEANRAGAIDLDDFNPEGHWEKLKAWSVAMDRHHDAKLVMDTLLDSSKQEFEAFARGTEVSGRLETPIEVHFQRYLLGYEGSYRRSP